MSKFPAVVFTGVIVYKRNNIYISSVSDELADQNIDHAAILRWLDGKWAHKTVDVAVRGMCVVLEPTLSLLNMGINGKIVKFTFPGEGIEYVDRSEIGPSDLLHLRAMAEIGNHVFVAGMARHVYRRDGADRWVAIDKGIFVPREERERAVGFNDICGLSENSIYAVGYGGEIWHFDGKTWKQEVSPTNVILNCARCAPNGDVYIGGMVGTIIRGSCGHWEVLEQTVTDKDIWGIACFNGKIFFSNYDGVFVLNLNSINKVDMKFQGKISTAYLDANDEVIWSVGHKDLAYSYDGIIWTKATSP